MKQVQSYIAVLCVMLVASSGLYAQNLTDRTPRLDNPGAHWYSRFTEPYQTRSSPPINVSNSGRADSLIRGGVMYLSLNDAIALALENNIDVEVQRYNFLVTDSQLRSSYAGAGGIYEPTVTSTINWGHSDTPTTNAINSGGVLATINDSKTRNFGVQQSFLTGAQATLGFNNNISTPNNPNSNFVPSFNSGLSLNASQPLLQGFGLAYNNRNIRIAKNNLKVTDYQFQLNLNTTLANVIQQYWNLVGDRMAVDVAQSTLDLNQTNLDNNNKQVQIGTMAPLDALTAEQAVENARTSLIRAKGTVLQQEVSLKNLLSRNGIASTSFAEVSIVPTDSITVPDVEPVQPIQDLIATALDQRPEVGQLRTQLLNSSINLKASKNQLLPSFNLTGNVSNPGIGGTLNPIQNINPQTGQVVDRSVGLNPDLIGGYSNILRQIFFANTVNYTVGFTLNIPLKNTAQKEAYIQQDLALKTSELGLQKELNQIRVDVQNAQIALTNARAQYASAVKSRQISQQVYDAEQQKYALGASTTYLVTQHLNDLTNARFSELQAQTTYVAAKLQMDQATSSILEHYNVQIDEAKNGRVSRRPDPIPAVPPAPVPNGAAFNQQGQPLNTTAGNLR